MSFGVDKQQLIRPDGTVDQQAFSRWYDELDAQAEATQSSAPFVDGEGRLHIPGWELYAFREDALNRALVVDRNTGGDTWEEEFRLGENA